MRWLLLAVLVLPSASAQGFEPFVGDLVDRPDDVVTRGFRPAQEPTTDIRNFTSRVLGGARIEQRVEMAEAPSLAQNSIIVRSWFRNSTNGSFYVLDLEVHSEAEGVDPFVSYTRRGAFENVTPVNATWTLDENVWIFTFDAAEVAPDAECFLPQLYAYFSGFDNDTRNGYFDSVGAGGKPCATTPEPGSAAPDSRAPRFPRLVAGVPTEERAAATPVEAPGTRTPTPSAALPLTLVGVALAAFALARRPKKP